MKLTTLFAAVGLAFCLIPSAQAEFIIGDYLTEGDQLTVIDTSSGLEWLNLNLTKGASYNNTIERTISGDLVGWRAATYHDLSVMLDSSFDVVNWQDSWNFGGYYAPEYEEAEQFAQLFANHNSVQLNAAYGYVKKGDYVFNAGGYINSGGYYYIMPLNELNGTDGYGTYYQTGTWLVRGQYDVPTPLTFGSLALGLIGFSNRRKKKQ